MDTIEFKSSKWKYALLSFFASLVVILGFFILFQGDRGGLFIVGFFGLGLLGFIKYLIDDEPRLIVDREGITDRTLWVGKILWEDIQGAHLHYIRGHRLICLELRDESKYLDRLSWPMEILTWGNLVFGGERLNLNLSGVNADEKEVLRIIIEYTSKYGRGFSRTRIVSYRNPRKSSVNLHDFRPGEKVLWYRYTPLPGLRWPIEATVVTTTAKLVKIKFSRDGQVEVRNVPPEKLRIKQQTN